MDFWLLNGLVNNLLECKEKLVVALIGGNVGAYVNAYKDLADAREKLIDTIMAEKEA